MRFPSISEFCTTVDKFVNWNLSEDLALGFEFLNSFMVTGKALPSSHSRGKKPKTSCAKLLMISRTRAQVFYQFYTIKVANINSRKRDLSHVRTWKLELQWSLEALSCSHQVCGWTRVVLLAPPQKLRHRMRESTHPASYFFCKKHSGRCQKQQAEGTHFQCVKHYLCESSAECHTSASLQLC